jgi:protein ImuB
MNSASHLDPRPAYQLSRIVHEPLTRQQDIEYVLRHLLQEMCAKLEQHYLGSRRMELTCYRPGGGIDGCEVCTSKPTRSVSHLLDLFREKLGALRSQFGFEKFALSVWDAETLNPKQLSFFSSEVAEDKTFDALIDRLATRLGSSEVNRIQVCESYLPEHSVEFHPATQPAPESAEWPAYRVRPIHLLDSPKRIAVSVLIPGGAPAQIIIGGESRCVVRSEGPERLTPEWWRENGLRVGTRDYYRIEDEKGGRYWVFRDSSERWFLHGHLP